MLQLPGVSDTTEEIQGGHGTAMCCIAFNALMKNPCSWERGGEDAPPLTRGALLWHSICHPQLLNPLSPAQGEHRAKHAANT